MVHEGLDALNLGFQREKKNRKTEQKIDWRREKNGDYTKIKC